MGGACFTVIVMLVLSSSVNSSSISLLYFRYGWRGKIATFVFPFVSWYPATLPITLSLCTLYLTLSIPVQMKENLSCARWKLKGFGCWSFSVRVPLVWSNLPAPIRHCSSLSQFNTALKIFLFTSQASDAVPD